MASIQLNVEGMSCMHCVKAVKEEVAKVEGVSTIDVSLENKTVKVEILDPGKQQEVVTAIETAGYEVKN
ncbi:MAG: heavy-metal-associated domain-containing protein [Leptospiraceae bacterium]|nr:heavy-metal-associated domain-containing protein [Leptospiraceae bacterium]MCP5513638.1 heavy-metal-associated domain-containing protein [Leptospiraceae bacterium]